MARFVMRNGTLVPIAQAGMIAKSADNGAMRSMAMGCATKSGQIKRIKHFAKRGIDVKFHPRTGQMLFSGGYHTQKKLAAHSGMEID